MKKLCTHQKKQKKECEALIAVMKIEINHDSI